jgi:hypothetical protein
VEEQTPELCIAAVQQDGLALEYVKEQTPELCLAAVQQNGCALRHVDEQTPELCLAAVQQDGCALEYVKKRTPELCMAAVQQNGHALKFVKKQTPELCLTAVQQNGWALHYVKKQSPELCIAAVRQNSRALEYVKYPKIRLTIVGKDGLLLRYLKNQTPELCLAAVRQNSWALLYAKKQTPELCFTAIQQNSLVREYLQNNSPELHPPKDKPYKKNYIPGTTNKARRIEKLDTLSREQKSKAIHFFSTHPNYEKYIDWNKKQIPYDNFEKIFFMADNSTKNIKRKSRDNPELLFKQYNCIIISQTKEFLIAVPLDWNCAVFFNSFNCGGEGAMWCIGDKKTAFLWEDYLSQKIIFFLLYFFRKHKSLGKKIMIEYTITDDYYILWSQKNKVLWDGYHVIDLVNISSGLKTDNLFLTKTVNQILKTAKDTVNINDIHPW